MVECGWLVVSELDMNENYVKMLVSGIGQLLQEFRCEVDFLWVWHAGEYRK